MKKLITILKHYDLCHFYLRSFYDEIKTIEEFEKYSIKNISYRKLARNVTMFRDKKKDEVFIVETGKKETVVYKSKNLEIYSNDNDKIGFEDN